LSFGFAPELGVFNPPEIGNNENFFKLYNGRVGKIAYR
jgi:hypothetical protein